MFNLPWAASGPGLAIICLLVTASPLPLRAADEAPGAGTTKTSLHEEPAEALRKFTVAPGLRVDLFAAEPDVRNPVSLCFDERGRCYVVETMRRRSSVFDIRNFTEWLDQDLSFRTVEERINFLKQNVTSANKKFADTIAKSKRGNFGDFNGDGKIDWHDLEVESERLRLLEDTDGDGCADRATVFADGFNSLVSGVAAGVLARRGEVYFACIPDLWRISNQYSVISAQLPLRDPPGPRTDNWKLNTSPLLTGFGVHIAFGGHDMHGLIFGPDGKLYWSIADRGTDTNLFAKIKNPIPGLTPELLADSGCIFRANPDGSDFEVIAWGLRNPQELAFDEFGNLFTADNNGDGGDKARWHYVVEGADFGWRIGWQWLEAKPWQPKMGPWNGERLWHLATNNTAAYLLPPLAHIGHGPAGLAYNPGTGLPKQFDRHFFLCDFPGSVLMWTNIPDGASFKVGPVKNFFGELGPSDVSFGVDGGVYVTDWFKSFEKPDKGRIYRIHDPATDASAAVQETKRLRAEGMEKRSVTELAQLLGHADMRVRLEAQAELFASALRSLRDASNSSHVLKRSAGQQTNRLARLHGLWGLSQIGLDDSVETIVRHLEDGDVEVRAQAAKLIGSTDWREAIPVLIRLLGDSSPRVRMFAASSLGKFHRFAPIPSQPLLELIRSNSDQDAYVRHAAVLALARIGDMKALLSSASDPSRSVRLGVLLALRRLDSPEVARFLSDSDPQLVLEAARAINDVPIPAAFPQLAALLNQQSYDAAPVDGSQISNSKSDLTQFTLRRALNASFRLGHVTNAQALANFAANAAAPEPLRLAASELLAEWPKPSGRDHIMGLWRPLPPREGRVAADALQAVLGGISRTAPGRVKLAATRAATQLGLQQGDAFTTFTDPTAAPAMRVDALKSLAAGKHPRLGEALQLAAADKSEAVRIAATQLQSVNSSVDVSAQLSATLTRGSVAEKQAVLASLAGAKAGSADELLAQQLDELLAGKLAQELQLDLLDAAAKRAAPAIKEKLHRYESSLPKNDPLASWRVALHGGNAEEGKKIFIERQEAACFRCHRVRGEGGEVGPELTGFGAKQSREYILESILFPNTQVAPGFETVIVALKNGTSYAGMVKSSTDTELVINSPEDGPVTVKVADIKARDRGLSAMPEEMGNVLSKQDVRNLVEFLATLK